jgi:hypothetical protein
MKTTETTNVHVLAAQVQATEIIRLATESAKKLIEETEANISLFDEMDVLQTKRVDLMNQVHNIDEQLRTLGAKAPKASMTLVNLNLTNTSNSNTGVGQMAYKLMESGMSNKEVLEEIAKHYNNNKTTKSCVAWYRNKYNHGARAEA